MMKTLLLRAEDLSALLATLGPDEVMDRMIEALRRRFTDHDPELQESRARDGFRYDKPAHGLVEWMPTHEVGGPVVVKMVGYHPTNPLQRNIPSVIATSSMWDTETGHLVAIADATLLTALRTGAASGLATDLLATPGPITLGVVGLGAQAVTQVHAISRVRELTSIIGIDTEPEISASFSSRVGFLDVPVEIASADRAATIAGEVDVLCTCTSADIGAPPVVGDTELRPWLHINAVGADFPGKLDLPASMVQRALVIPDTLEQCLVEGECQQIGDGRIGPELAEVTKSAEEFAGRRGDFTIFDSTGWAVEDDIALRLAVELCEQHGLGTSIELERIPVDPFDPYATPT
jgi:ornithine cyclodeaminase/alanine dehydrogenase-like protein (mu-crystallin family)